ncbi:hypothetical protein O163_00480 [Caldanaerobacter subterraneus subsp. yonseiensis KB-1]|uniref:Uncharacterized protein n=1 Tax=Caldanaerobacter subterraneus subsp. yonseiensis KB-1 TaxID=1388761 RepID=U5CK27_CALSX|nr:hypothetical protein O163_00480 [Caldanaerobacter subterraneus subsp. yonseiensis KB-1]
MRKAVSVIVVLLKGSVKWLVKIKFRGERQWNGLKC